MIKKENSLFDLLSEKPWEQLHSIRAMATPGEDRSAMDKQRAAVSR